MKIKQQLIFYTQSIAGMLISHYIPTKLFWLWVAVSLYLGHLINVKNYKTKVKELQPSKPKTFTEFKNINAEMILTEQSSSSTKVGPAALSMLLYAQYLELKGFYVLAEKIMNIYYDAVYPHKPIHHKKIETFYNEYFNKTDENKN